MDDAIRKLIEWLSTASPALWAILLKQVQVEMIISIVWIGFFTGVGCAVYMYVTRMINSMESGENRTVAVWMRRVGVVFLIFIILLIGNSVLNDILNPEWRAIQIIISQFTQK